MVCTIPSTFGGHSGSDFGLPAAAGLGYQQSYRLCCQLVLQHECLGPDLGQSHLSCLQLFAKVSKCWTKKHLIVHLLHLTRGLNNLWMQFGILLKHSNVVIIPCVFWKVKKVTNCTFEWYLCFLLNELYLWYDLNRGNWWGHSPYKHGTPCSACPPSYGGGCKDNLCYKGSENLDGGTGEHKNHFFPHCTPFCNFTRRWQLWPTARGNRGKQLNWVRSPSRSAEALVQAQSPHPSPCQAPHRYRGAAEEWSGQHTTDV